MYKQVIVHGLAGCVLGLLLTPVAACFAAWMHTSIRLSTYWGHYNLPSDVQPSTRAASTLLLIMVVGTGVAWELWVFAGWQDPSVDRLKRLTWAVVFVGLCNSNLIVFWLVDAALMEPIYKLLPKPFWLASFVRVLIGYGNGAVVLLFHLAVFEALFYALELAPVCACRLRLPPSCPRRWRGHWYPRYYLASLAFNIGAAFNIFWVCFEIWAIGVWGMQPRHLPGQGQWWQYPFPFAMDYVGVWGALVLSSAVFLAQRHSDRDYTHDKFSWTHRRAVEVKRYCRGVHRFGTQRRAAQHLICYWEELRHGLRRGFQLLRVLKLAFNRFCPTHMRPRLQDGVGMQLSIRQGLQGTLDDEIEWHRVGFIVTSVITVFPLVLGWFHDRYMDPQDAFLVPQYGTQLVSEGSETWSWSAFLPPGVNVVVKDTYDSIWPQAAGALGTCVGVTPAVDVLPDRSYYFNAQLLLYVIFFVYCSWLVRRESEEKTCVSVATRMGGIFDRDSRWPSVVKWIDRTAMLLLSGLYALCLTKNSVTQGYLLVHDDSLYHEESGAFGYWYAVCEAVAPGTILAVKYSLTAGDTVWLNVLQGIVFLYSCYNLAEVQTEVYDFVHADTFFTLHLEEPFPWACCTYWRLGALRDSGIVVKHEDVCGYLHTEVYAPFLSEVRNTWPGFFEEFLNDKEAAWLHGELDRVEAEERQKDKGDSMGSDEEEKVTMGISPP